MNRYFIGLFFAQALGLLLLGAALRGCAVTSQVGSSTEVVVHEETVGEAGATIDEPTAPRRADIYAPEPITESVCVEVPERLAPAPERTADEPGRWGAAGLSSPVGLRSSTLRYDPAERRTPWLLLPIRSGLPAVSLTHREARVEAFDTETGRASIITYRVPPQRWGGRVAITASDDLLALGSATAVGLRADLWWRRAGLFAEPTARAYPDGVRAEVRGGILLTILHR